VVAFLCFALATGCGGRPTVTVSGPFAADTVVDDIRADLEREGLRGRRGVVIDVRDDTAATLALDGTPIRPRFPRDSAISACIAAFSGDEAPPIVVAFPRGDERRREEAALFGDAGAILVAIDAPQDLNGTEDEIFDAVGDTDATIVLLLADWTPSVALRLQTDGRAHTLVVEAFLASTVARMRGAGLDIAGSIVFDLAGTVLEADNRERDARSVVYLPAVFIR
jgi:hypothetical protein